MAFALVIQKNSLTFAPQMGNMLVEIKNGALTERLGSGLQNRPRQFESARHLLSSHLTGGCLNFINPHYFPEACTATAKALYAALQTFQKTRHWEN